MAQYTLPQIRGLVKAAQEVASESWNEMVNRVGPMNDYLENLDAALLPFQESGQATKALVDIEEPEYDGDSIDVIAKILWIFGTELDVRKETQQKITDVLNDLRQRKIEKFR